VGKQRLWQPRSCSGLRLEAPSNDIAVVGSFPPGLPRFVLPNANINDVLHLVRGRSLGIFVVSFAGEILIARSFAGEHNQDVRSSQELMGMGAANAGRGVTQGFSIGASGARSVAKDEMGGGQVAGYVALLRWLIDMAESAKRRSGGTIFWGVSRSARRAALFQP
jgi:MFS superfamily sulfate permease-like transporter